MICRKRIAVAGQLLLQKALLVDRMGPPGIQVHLLQKNNLRLQLLQNAGDSLHVLLYALLTRRADHLPAIHEEIRVVSECSVSDIPGQHRKRLSRCHLFFLHICNDKLFLRLRSVFRHREHDKQHHKDCKHNAQHSPHKSRCSFHPPFHVCFPLLFTLWLLL